MIYDLSSSKSLSDNFSASFRHQKSSRGKDASWRQASSKLLISNHLLLPASDSFVVNPPSTEMALEGIIENKQLDPVEQPLEEPQKDAGKDNEKPGPEEEEMATVGDMFSFINAKSRTRAYVYLGIFFSALAGLAYPGAAFALASVFSTISGDAMTNQDYLNNIALNAYIMVGIGVWSFITMSISSFLLEIAAKDMAFQLSSDWFSALLRQDMAYHDLVNVSGAASLIATNTATYARGMGRKMGEGIIFFVALLGGFAYALYSSWEVTLIVIAILPVMAFTAVVYGNLAKGQDAFADKNYAEAGGIVYTSVLSIRTVLSLNAVENMITNFREATGRAFNSARDRGWVLGFASGCTMAAFQFSYLILTLFGSFMVYKQVRKDGCDPSASLITNASRACSPSGENVFGAFLGMSLAGTGIPQVAGAMELFTKARTAIFPGMSCIKRKINPEDTTDKKESDEDLEKGKLAKQPTLPTYAIDSAHPGGLKPKNMEGNISFKHVKFVYPARPTKTVLADFNLEIKAGQTVALVGNSGGGKSTIVSLLERFYDPIGGSVTVDGVDVRDFNVKYLREKIGLVQQEPALFSGTIAENIMYGKLGSTMEDVKRAATMANANGFIEALPEGYDTPVGSGKLSGGQKQRIAIARTLMKHPSILLLDEATSALDSESELIVQRALNDLLEKTRFTTIIIAHRLSTIRNADMIVYVKDGVVMETGTHDGLMEKEDGYYKKLVEAGSAPAKSAEDKVEENEQEDEAEPTPAEEESAVAEVPAGESNLQLNFRDVNFSYPTRGDHLVFKGLNLAVKPGETMALVGPSGQGKSTIIGLIERFYDPLKGTVELLGSDLKEINVRYLRDQIGLVEQEPTLFAMSIGENIGFSRPDATREEIIEAAKAANAHDFISAFPDGYETDVGQRGSQLSGGQKQRIAIARAVLKRPKIMLLDEATSALDSESQFVVQEALDKLSTSNNQTTLIIAHRLSTIRKANRIAYIAGGVVQELGSFDELIAKPNGKFKHLFELQNMRASAYLDKLKNQAEEPEKKDESDQKTAATVPIEEDDEQEAKRKSEAEEYREPVSGWRFVEEEDYGFLALGTLGAIITGMVFPGWGVMLAQTIVLLYTSVDQCDANNPPPSGFATCQDYWTSVANNIQDDSFILTYGWLGIIGITIIGNTLLFQGFQAAAEKMTKRVRDLTFEALLRQEIAYFDLRNVGDIVTQMQEDAGLLQAFAGEPIRLVSMSVASLLVAVLLSFIFMWPFALMVIAVLPFMSISHVIAGQISEESDEEEEDDEFGPGSVALESMTLIRTVASLSLERDRYEKYTAALEKHNNESMKKSAMIGLNYGLGQLLLQAGSALIFWWGGWLLVNYPNKFTSTDFLTSLAGLLLALNSLSLASQGMSDRNEAQAAVQRLADLIDRESKIDPLSEEGKKTL